MAVINSDLKSPPLTPPHSPGEKLDRNVIQGRDSPTTTELAAPTVSALPSPPPSFGSLAVSGEVNVENFQQAASTENTVESLVIGISEAKNEAPNIAEIKAVTPNTSAKEREETEKTPEQNRVTIENLERDLEKARLGEVEVPEQLEMNFQTRLEQEVQKRLEQEVLKRLESENEYLKQAVESLNQAVEDGIQKQAMADKVLRRMKWELDEVKQAFNTEADNSGGSLPWPPQNLKRRQVTSKSVGEELEPNVEANFRRNVYLEPVISPFLRYMIIVTKINPGPRPQLIGALPPFLTQPEILQYHKDDIQSRVSQFNDWCLAANVQPDFCQMYKYSNGSKVTTCDFQEQKGRYLHECNGLRLCSEHRDEFKARGGSLRSVRRTEDKANAVEIYMSPDLFFCPYAVDENEAVVKINYEKLRHSLQFNYVDTYGCAYDNPGDGKDKFFDVKTGGLRRNMGRTSDPRQRNEDKPKELGADLSNAGFLSKFREEKKVEGMTHGFLKAMGLHVNPIDPLNQTHHSEFFLVSKDFAAVALDQTLKALEAYRPEIIHTYDGVQATLDQVVTEYLTHEQKKAKDRKKNGEGVTGKQTAKTKRIEIPSSSISKTQP